MCETVWELFSKAWLEMTGRLQTDDVLHMVFVISKRLHFCWRFFVSLNSIGPLFFCFWFLCTSSSSFLQRTPSTHSTRSSHEKNVREMKMTRDDACGPIQTLQAWCLMDSFD